MRSARHHRSTSLCLTIIALILLIGQPARAVVTSLYDGSLNTLPGAQGWVYLTNPFIGAAATQSVSGGVTTLNTNAVESDQAGYFGSLPVLVPAINRTDGFTVSFDLRIVSESHSSNNRAGFSVIALSQDVKGIELGFWTDEIWAQSGPDFLHAEGTAINTTTSLTQYDLTVLGDNYYLFAGGSQILTGALRDYSSFGLPYTTPNFLFFGDDTSSASAEAELASIAIGTGADVVPPALVPLPAALPLFFSALIGLGVLSRRRVAA